MTSNLPYGTARYRVHFAALFIGLVSLAAPASGYQPSAPLDDSWQRMIAASPQRELARAWERCVANIAAVMLPQRGTVSQFRELGIGGCEADQSRLTGALVREFGYDRANRAVAGRVAALIRDYEQRLSAAAHPSLPANVIERTPDGWVIERINGRCVGHLLEQTSFGSRASILTILPEGEFLLFRDYGGDAPARARRMRDGDTLIVTANLSRGPNYTGRLVLPLTVSVRDSGYGFITPLTPQLADFLSSADAIHFQVDIGLALGLPHTYPTTGFPVARDATRHCEQR